MVNIFGLLQIVSNVVWRAMEKMASKITKNFYSYGRCSWLLNVVYYWPQCCVAYVTKHMPKITLKILNLPKASENVKICCLLILFA